MIKTSYALCILLIASSTFAQPLCPRSREVGNFINYLHLFKEEADSLLSFYNAKTDVTMIHQFIGPLVFGRRSYRVAFRVVDSNSPSKSWIYGVSARVNAANVITEIRNFGKARSLPNDPANPDVSKQFPDRDYIKSLFALIANPVLGPIPCYNSVIKLEYDYFYYMFANYYKNGSGTNAPTAL